MFAFYLCILVIICLSLNEYPWWIPDEVIKHIKHLWRFEQKIIQVKRTLCYHKAFHTQDISSNVYCFIMRFPYFSDRLFVFLWIGANIWFSDQSHDSTLESCTYFQWLSLLKMIDIHNTADGAIYPYFDAPALVNLEFIRTEFFDLRQLL